jgi:hypothetical protein
MTKPTQRLHFKKPQILLRRRISSASASGGNRFDKQFRHRFRGFAADRAVDEMTTEADTGSHSRANR